MLLVEIFERCGHLGNVMCSLPLRKTVFLSKVFVQFASACEFQDQENPLAIVEVSIEPQDVRVTKVALDLDLTPNLFLYPSLLQFGLVKDLKCTNESGRSLLGQIDPAKFSLSQGLANLEHSKVKFLWRRLLVGLFFIFIGVALDRGRIRCIDPVIIGILQSELQ